MLKNKKIVFCIDSLAKGGAERVVSILANKLIENNEVSIITILDKDVEYELNSNIKLIELGKGKKYIKNRAIRKIKYVFGSINILRKMKHSFKGLNPDIIISFLPITCFFSIIANNKKYRMILSDRNDPKQEYSNFIYNFLMKKLYPKVDAFVFQTQDAKGYFDNIIDFDKKEWKIIFNPVNPDFKNCKEVNVRKKKIVSVGRLTEQKNMELLINAFSKIYREFPEYSLTIYGEGEKREYLEKIIKEKNLTEKVFLPGIINDIKEEIYDASLFVMPSNYEGMPNALIEAMVLGLPVISTNCPCGGPRMLIDNTKNGYLINVGNEKELSETMKLILSEDELRENIGKEAKKIIDLVDIDVINREWQNFIELMIKE